MKVALIDPSLFTGPYDAALDSGLSSAGVETCWITRPTRKGDRQEVPVEHVAALFYRHVDDAAGLPKPLRTPAKGLAHLVGLLRTAVHLVRTKPDVIHVQWVVLPPFDLPALWLIKRSRPLILTVHDTVPFNGERMSLLQNLGFHAPIRLADQVIVHTESGKETLVRHGLDANKINVVPHGSLPLHAEPDPDRPPRDQGKYNFVLFGELKPYKGLDVLVEAVGAMPEAVRAQAHFIVAGRERMDLSPITSRIKALGLEGTIEIRAQRQSEAEMANLFADCDCFVFPYRQIDASGVYFLTKSFNRWMIASKVGIFAVDIVDGAQGCLVSPEDVLGLSVALCDAVVQRRQAAPASEDGSWQSIGKQTRAVYEKALCVRQSGDEAISARSTRTRHLPK